MKNILIKPEKCGACRICELVCSHHHAQVFGRLPSSIEIYKDYAGGRVEICIHSSDSEGHYACDHCIDEHTPACAAWCPVGAIIAKKG